MYKKITRRSGQGLPCLSLRKLITWSSIVLWLCMSRKSQGQIPVAFTIHVQNTRLEKIFELIERQSSYRVMYLEKYLKQTKPVTLKVKDAGIIELLDKSLNDQGLDYKIVEQSILISPKKPSTPSMKTSVNESPDKDTLMVFGRVTSKDGMPLPGATVMVEGSANGATTDEHGQFKLASGSRLNGYITISYVGFNSQRIELPLSGSKGLNIELQPAKTTLRSIDVVSTGYQLLPRERATGSFAQPEKVMFENRVSSDVVSKLEGITSGVVFNRGNLGANESSIKIRGQNTIYANDAPLVVVDGFPYEGEISNINPNDVENLTVLKDAAAASIWGVRAGNGVVVITTKRGKFNAPLTVSMNLNTTVNAKPDLNYDPNFLPSAPFIEVEKSLFDKGFYDDRLNDPGSVVVSPVVELLEKQRRGQITADQLQSALEVLKSNDVRQDQKKYFYRAAVNQQYSAAMNGGSKTLNYYFSGGYDRNLGAQTGFDYSRLKLVSQNTIRPIENLEISVGIDYTQTLNHSDNALAQQITGGGYNAMYPYAKYSDNKNNPVTLIKDYRPEFIVRAAEHGFLDWSYAPLKERGLYTGEVKNVDTRILAGLKYQIVKGFSVELKTQMEKGNRSSVNLADGKSYYVRNMVNTFSVVNIGEVSLRPIPAGGIRMNGNQDYNSVNYRGQLNYSRNFGVHEITGLAGIEQREQSTRGNSSNLYGYDPQTGNSAPVDYTSYFQLYPSGNYAQIASNTGVSGTINRYRSYYSNLSYSYNQRYTASLSGRMDASNYFGVKTNQKIVPLWSAGIKWGIDKEGFFHSGLLDQLSLRATYGFSGNLASNLAAVTTFRYEGNSFLTGANVASIANIPNPDLRWEKTAMFNLGLDFMMLHQRITGSIEYFRKRGVDLIGDAVIDPTTGVNQLTGNFAGMRGSGIDLQIGGLVIDRKFKWRLNLLLSHVTDQISSYGIPVPAYQAISGGVTPILGRPVYGMYSYRWAGLDPLTGDPQGYIGKVLSKDYGALLSPSDKNDIVYNGPARPSWYGGLTSTLGLGGFSLSWNLNFKFGYVYRRSSINYGSLYNSWIGHMDYLNRWKVPGDERKTSVPSMNYPADYNRDNFYAGSEVLIEKGDHIRLQDISLSYQLKKMPQAVKGLQVYVYGNNLGILWRAGRKGIDPDFPLGGIPIPRTISFGVKAQF